MIGSLNTGVSALNGFQRGMEVVGNNIANANTYGFKSQRVEYKDSFYDTLNRSVSDAAFGVTSTANQVGMGLQANTLGTNYNQGPIDSTGIDTDVAIEGRGYFKAIDYTNPDNPRELFTRAGNFRINDEGYLTTAEGFLVQGQSISDGAVSMVATGTSDGQGVPADGFAVEASDLNADGTFTVGQTLTLPANFNGGAGYLDTANGVPEIHIIGDGAGAEAEAIVTDGIVTGVRITAAGSGFTNAVVRIEEPPPNDLNYTVVSAPALGEVGGIRIDTPTLGIVPPPTTSAINTANVDALAPKLQNFAIQKDGTIQVVLDNGEKITVGKLLLQDFKAPQALSRKAGTYFMDDGNAGAINLFDGTAGQPGVGALGILRQGSLELSNASLTDDFADLITTQRSFQGAARIITTSDEILREAVNIKR